MDTEMALEILCNLEKLNSINNTNNFKKTKK